MDDSTISLTDAELYQIAIHEAGHLVAYYLLNGNIDIIKSVSVGIRDGEKDLGRVKEDSGAKLAEAFDLYYEDEEGFYKVGGCAFKECCYSLAGVIADKIFLNLDHIPFSHSCSDWFSIKGWLDNFPGDDSIIDSLVEAAIPETEKLVHANFDYIRKVADAIIAAPNHELDNPSLNALLERVFPEERRGPNRYKGLDERFDEVARFVVSRQNAMQLVLQYYLDLGDYRAKRILNQLEGAGIVGPANNQMEREVLVKDLEELEQILSRNAAHQQSDE
jgi:hypothetical protein